MNSLMRNSTLAISHRRRFDHYEVLEQSMKSWGEDGRAPRSVFKTKREHNHMISAFSNTRRERAKKRQIYLHSYTFSSAKTKTKCTSRVLKKGLVKAKSAFVKILAFVRVGSIRTCGVSKTPILCCSSPMPIPVRRVVPA
ncbi:hypothetical protein IFM89_002138 [Coptis chinensis]|uniref:Uncharacterized protein n=1 Tax=Coptis chinensis TaxID=261450 RepID=A0A835LD50_9MAGN|nr:hypothetical protein IFM89_002138 [Coptis chinensis]